MKGIKIILLFRTTPPMVFIVNLILNVRLLLRNRIDTANADVNTDSQVIFMSLVGRHFGVFGERVGNLEN